MHRLLTRVLFVALVLTAVWLAGADTAADADTKCTRTDPATGKCLIWVIVPDDDPDPTPAAEDGPKDSGSGQACYWDPSKQGVVGPPAGPVPCKAAEGYWSNNLNCYVRQADPQPPASDPSWKGHEPGDGAVYLCFQPQTGILITLWSQDEPAGAGGGVTPREVAQIAIADMELSAVRIGIAPKPGPNSVGLVGMPVWMWARNPDDHTFGPIKATATAGGITIAATAKVLKVIWDMGDGTAVICKTAGKPYNPSYGRKESPTCGHKYMKSSAGQPGEKFKVSATSDWVVTWSGAGQTGTIRLNGLVRSTQITIGEAQVLVD